MPRSLSGSIGDLIASLDPQKLSAAYEVIPPGHGLLVCPRIGSGVSPEPGWQVGLCCICGRSVWSNPDAESAARMMAPGVSCVCVECVTTED